MTRFRVSAEDFSSREVECIGCHGDALTLALSNTSVAHWKVNRRSPDGRSWFFDVALEQPGGAVMREFRVDTLS